MYTIKPAIDRSENNDGIWSPLTALMLNRRRRFKNEYEPYTGKTCLTLPLSA